MRGCFESFKELFICNGESRGWTEATRTGFILSLEGNMLRLRKKFGRDPFLYEVVQAVGELLDDYDYAHGGGVDEEQHERMYPYRIIRRDGTSGCLSYFIEVDKGDGFPDRRRLLDVSCYGKVACFNMAPWDFVALMEVMYPDGFKPDPDLDIRGILPRDTSQEGGWTRPEELPETFADYHDVCRQKLTRHGEGDSSGA